MEQFSRELDNQEKDVESQEMVNLRTAWADVLSSRAGRRVVHDLLSVCHFGMSSYAGDANTTMFVAGKQKVGEEIMNMINLSDPDAFFKMTKEYQDERRSTATGGDAE